MTNIYSKRKSVDGEQSESGVCKKHCYSPPAESTPCGSVLLQELAEQQEEVLRGRMMQEEEDRRMAMRLQRELNRELSVDRRKGSADGYLLRDKISPSSSSSTSPGEENKMDKTNNPHSLRHKVDGHKAGRRASSQVECKAKKNSVSTPVSSSSASPVQKSRKQTTLIEMFPSLGS